MSKTSADNTRIKHAYQRFLREAKGQSEASIDKALAAIEQFEADTGGRPFKRFHVEAATAFKRRLRDRRNAKTGKPISASTVTHTLNALRSFFIWLADRPGYKSAVRYSDAEYFNVTEKERALASAPKELPVPTLELVRHVLATMPAATVIEKRDRAVIAFTALSGARDNAIASFRLKHIDLGKARIHQAGGEVRTKFSKTFTSNFFPVGDDMLSLVAEWVEELQSDLHFGPDDPLFPKTRIVRGSSRHFEVAGLTRETWSTATPIRKIFRSAFETADLPYFNPHSFRHMLSQLGQQLCRTGEELKAWSQNLGHEDVMTMIRSYGPVDSRRQAEIMWKFRQPQDDEEKVLKAIRKLLS